MNKRKPSRSRAATPKQAIKLAAPSLQVKVSAYNAIIDAISLIEIVRRSMGQEAHELVALKCAVKSLWQVHDQLDELGIGGNTDDDDE